MVFDQNAARWACQKRGLCCRTYRIGVMDEEGRRISSMLAAAADPLAPLFSPAPEQLPVDDQGACVFLDGSLCGYRQRHGPETLPAACRRYPRLALRTPERTLLELSLACPTALDLFVQRPRPSFATGDVPLADDIAFDVRTSEVEYRDLAGGPLDAATFWEQHRVLCDRFSAMRGDPLTRLLDWTAEFAGVPIVPIALDWTTAIAGDDDSLPLPYLLQGGDLPLLAMLLAATREPPGEIDLPTKHPDDSELLAGYLERRLQVPTWLRPAFSLDALLCGLHGMAIRYWVERERGSGGPETVWRLDKQFVHGGFVAQLCRTGRSGAPWRASARLLASLAEALTPPAGAG